MHEAVLQEIEATIARLAERWKDAGILLPAFPLLARGKPLPVEDIAKASGASLQEVQQALDSGRCERDSQGVLVDLYGMSLSPTLHRVEVAKKIIYSCCALWTHVIPKLVQQTVRVESVDPVQREIVRLTITPSGIHSVEPADAVATLAVAEASEIRADVCAAFCCQVRHFVSRESAEQFIARPGPQRHIVELNELQEASGLLFQSIWKAVKDPLSQGQNLKSLSDDRRT